MTAAVFDELLATCGVGPNTLSPREARALDEHGVVILRDVAQSGALERLRAAFERTLAPAIGGGAGREGAARNVELTAWSDERFLVLFTHPRVLAAARFVLGRPFRLFQLGGRSPARGHGRQGLHQDWLPRRPGDPASVVTALWALDDFTAKNGATRAVPGSHRLALPLPKSMRQPHARHPDEMPLLPEAGSVLLFDGHLWHAGAENASGAPRRSFQLQFVARDAAPPPDLPRSLPDHLDEPARMLLGID